MNNDEQIRKVLDAIGGFEPSDARRDQVVQLSAQLRSLIDQGLAATRIPYEIQEVGSYAKGTALADSDLDLFVLVPETEVRHVLYRLEQRIRPILSIERMNVQTAYLRGTYDGISFDIVPCPNLVDLRMNSNISRTPLHTEHVRTHLDASKQIEVRWLKQFFRTIGVYGADGTVNGLSGYTVECLIIRFGSFIRVLRHLAQAGIHSSIDDSTLEGVLSFADPVDPKRNLFGSITVQTFARLQLETQLFLSAPSERFFRSRETVPERSLLEPRWNSRASFGLVLELQTSETVPGIRASQLRRFVRQLEQVLCSEDHPVFRSSTLHVEAQDLILVEFEHRYRSLVRQMGPETDRSIVEFVQLHQQKSHLIRTLDHRVVAERPARSYDVRTLLAQLGPTGRIVQRSFDIRELDLNNSDHLRLMQIHLGNEFIGIK